MNRRVNFKIKTPEFLSLSDREYMHVFYLTVEACEEEVSKKIYFSVVAYAHKFSVGIRISPFFEKVENSIEFSKKVEEKYPPFNDLRDYDIENSPEFDINLI